MHKDEEKKRVRSLSNEGHSIRKIAEMTGIPKSTVADLLHEAPEQTHPEFTLPELSEECPASINSPSREESDSFSDDSRPIPGQFEADQRFIPTQSDVIRTTPGQNNGEPRRMPITPDSYRSNQDQNIFANRLTYKKPGEIQTKPIPLNPKNQKTMYESEEKVQNRPDKAIETMSPGEIEVKKLALQLSHDIEMRKMDQEDAKIKLKQQEDDAMKEESDKALAKKTKRAMEISEKIRSLAIDLLDKGVNYEWDANDAGNFLDEVVALIAEFKEFCIKYEIYYRDSEYYRFLISLKESFNMGIEDLDDEDNEDGPDTFNIEFSNQDLKQIDKATCCDISKMF